MRQLLILLASTMIFATLAQAQIPTDFMEKVKTVGTEKFKGISENCKSEKIKYCKDKSIGALKICLMENKNNLSPKCKSAVGI